jgi:hypothetical protein
MDEARQKWLTTSLTDYGVNPHGKQNKQDEESPQIIQKPAHEHTLAEAGGPQGWHPLQPAGQFIGVKIALHGCPKINGSGR